MKAILGSVLFGFDREVALWVQDRIPAFEASPDAVALGVTDGEKLVAGVVYERFNGVHVECSIAADGPGWASRATLFALFQYPFGQLGCVGISVICPFSNLRSLNLATKLGFEPEAIIRFAAYDGGDLLVLKMYRDKCRWLGAGHEQEGRQRSASRAGPVQDGIR